MGRYYWGDIEGKFAFAIQSSYDPEEFGVDAIEIHSWDCGCESEYGVEPEVYNCGDPEKNHRNCQISDSQNSDKSEDSEENTNTQSDSPNLLKFEFSSEQLEDIKEKLDEILDMFPTDFKEVFFNTMKTINGYNKQSLANDFKISESELDIYLRLYYRYELGKEIYDYLLTHDTCNFYGET
jgi:hypothetical protein